jgi:hypothetical protein
MVGEHELAAPAEWRELRKRKARTENELARKYNLLANHPYVMPHPLNQRPLL